MESAFAWLNKIFEYIWAFVPRPYLVTWTHRGVRYRRGSKPVLVKPGVRWFWPLTTSVNNINVTMRADEYRAHVYTTKDGKSVAIAYTLVYKVADPVKADSSCDDYASTIGEMAEAILSPIVASRTFAELLDALAQDAEAGGLNAQLTRAAKKMTRPFGVRVLYCRVHTFANVRVFKLLQEEH